MPFGDESAASTLAASAVMVNQPPEESFTKNLKMCAITRNQSNGKIQVGIVNMATRKNYFLHEGDSEDGLEIIQADFDNEKALLRHNAKEEWMDMTSATATTPALTFGPHGMQIMKPSQTIPLAISTTASDHSADQADISTDSSSPTTLDAEFQRILGQHQAERAISREGSEIASAMPAPVGGGGFGWVNNSSAVSSGAKDQTATASPAALESPAALALNQSMASALEVAATIPPPDPTPIQVAAMPGFAAGKNDAPVMDSTPDAPQLTAAYLQKQLQDYQMVLIRSQGEQGPPLPIVLTPSMDAQLVSEGVLPPRAQ